jgi:phytoene dehydrogenase-like protein
MKHCIVAGGGFRGILSALFLARRGLQVTLLDSAPALGGVLASKSWQGFDLDLGCHLFDNKSDDETDLILEILGEHYDPVSVRYASKFLGRMSEGLAVPSFAGAVSA